MMSSSVARSLCFLAFATLVQIPLQAQQNRLAQAIDNRQTVVLSGRVHPKATAAADRGAVADSFAMPGMTLYFKRSSTQQADLEQLLAGQQDPSSPNYHQWLTPEQYADRFGLSAADFAQVQGWLQAQGFTVTNASRSRTFVTFDGTAGLVRGSFRTPVHRYNVEGKAHYSNSADPVLPSALASLVSSIRGLNDFRLKPHIRTMSAAYNTGGGTHEMAPGDFATIYDVTPLYQSGIDGTGQSLAIIGQTRITLSDLTNFRNTFSLSAINLKQVLTGQDPGYSSGDLPEADLDLEWSGAVARNAQIIYVYATDVITALTYAIDQNIAPVVSMSYGACEAMDLIDLPSYQAMAQQANAQGMTWIGVTGDNAAADCEITGNDPAQSGLAVDAPGAIPEVTAMGGTMFAEGSTSYWGTNNGNGNTNGGSALSYIPEAAWNETSSVYGLAGTGGGASSFFPQPSWQTGAGVPNDGVRHVPDISFNAASGHDPYYIYSTYAQAVGGTSAAAPVMAGVVALLNHYLTKNNVLTKPGLANINPTLYRMAQTYPAAFHDVTLGSNIVPCVVGSPDCATGTMGYSSAANYDMATGLGSLDVAKFVTAWANNTPTATSVVASIDANPVFQQGSSWPFTLTLSEEAGIGATVTGFTIDGVSYTSKLSSLFGTATIAAHGSISANMSLSNVSIPKSVTFVFTGTDASGNSWTSQMAIPFSGPQPAIAIGGVTNAASYQKAYAPGEIISVFGTGLGDFVQSAATVPLPQFLAGFEAYVNNVAAPLYYVSPNQVNIQIPYETASGLATLTVGNPWANANFAIRIASSAPGIFALSSGAVNPSTTAAHGQTVTMYITGEGKVSPTVATGSAPAARTTPKPVLPVTVTVGGVQLTSAQLPYVGIPSWGVGVTQINFTIPASVPVGSQPVIVTVGTVSSPPATITITQ